MINTQAEVPAAESKVEKAVVQSAKTTEETPVKAQPSQEVKTTVKPQQTPQLESLALKKAITRDGAWEVINGERIYKKEVETDPSIPGHVVLRVRTFIPGTNAIKQGNNRMDTIHLFDNAQAYIQFFEPQFRAAKNGDQITEFKTKYDEKTKEFIPIIVDKDNNTYIGEEIIQFWLK